MNRVKGVMSGGVVYWLVFLWCEILHEEGTAVLKRVVP